MINFSPFYFLLYFWFLHKFNKDDDLNEIFPTENNTQTENTKPQQNKIHAAENTNTLLSA